MPGLEDLYREIILDHYRSPRNRGELPAPPARVAQGHNPLCGDEITVYLQVDDDVVSDVRVGGQGCSISQSSASMMSQAVNHGEAHRSHHSYTKSIVISSPTEIHLLRRNRGQFRTG